TAAGHAAGLMLQKLPADGGDEDGWNRASALFSTLGAAELLDTPGTRLLHRLFHEEAPQVVGGQALAFGCSCSRERVEAVLRSVGRDEAEAALIDGVDRVRCEVSCLATEIRPAVLHEVIIPAPGVMG